MRLYSYFRSSAAWRVRIALNFKGLTYETVPVHLLKQGGEQLLPGYRKLNPLGLVPALAVGENDAAILTQSLAIIEYLDEAYPQAPLLPKAALDRAYVRSIALTIACDIHPLNNLRVLRYLKHKLGIGDDNKDDWYRHWCMEGLSSIEATLASDPRTGKFCFGDSPSLADCCLIPQVYNAQRLKCNLSVMPTILRIRDACLALDAFNSSSPENQPDTEP